MRMPEQDGRARVTFSGGQRNLLCGVSCLAKASGKSSKEVPSGASPTICRSAYYRRTFRERGWSLSSPTTDLPALFNPDESSRHGASRVMKDGFVSFGWFVRDRFLPLKEANWKEETSKGVCNYLKIWWTWSGSNRRPLPCHFSSSTGAERHGETASNTEGQCSCGFGRYSLPFPCT